MQVSWGVLTLVGPLDASTVVSLLLAWLVNIKERVAPWIILVTQLDNRTERSPDQAEARAGYQSRLLFHFLSWAVISSLTSRLPLLPLAGCEVIVITRRHRERGSFELSSDVVLMWALTDDLSEVIECRRRLQQRRLQLYQRTESTDCVSLLLNSYRSHPCS